MRRDRLCREPLSRCRTTTSSWISAAKPKASYPPNTFATNREITCKTRRHHHRHPTGRSDEYYTLSTVKAERPKDWSGLQEAFAEGRIIGGRVIEVVKGGLRVDVGARAFMPASRSGARDMPDMEKLVGQEIRCKITKLDVEKDDIVVDRRVVFEQEEKERREAALSAVHEGQVIRGTVKTLMDFGAFIDIGGIDGLLHVTDMSWTRVNKPSDMLKRGEEVDVKVLKVNARTGRSRWA